MVGHSSKCRDKCDDLGGCKHPSHRKQMSEKAVKFFIEAMGGDEDEDIPIWGGYGFWNDLAKLPVKSYKEANEFLKKVCPPSFRNIRNAS